MTLSATLSPGQVAPHMSRFLSILDAAFQRYGAPGGLPKRLRHAVATTPRHLFVHRFRLRGDFLDNRTDDHSLRDNDADPAAMLTAIYSDAVMTHVDASGEPLRSTNSQPSYVLWLLHLLDLQPGQRVLEIGSGSGWLAAVMACLVGENGAVTGIEIIPELAAQSRTDIARLGIGNLIVLATDGARGHASGAPFDRVMITAATWDLPAMLFDQLAKAGRVLVPVELRGGGCQVAVLRHEEHGFVAENAVPGWFVPLVGSAQQRSSLRLALAELPFWSEIGGAAPRHVPLPLVAGPEGAAGAVVAAFRAFLGRTELGFTVFGDREPREQRPWLPTEPFGIVDEIGRSAALWSGGEMLGYGGPTAMRSLAHAYASWTSFGLPGVAGFGLRIIQGTMAPASDGRTWIEKRGRTTLIWTPSPNAEDWKVFLDDAP